MDNENVAGRPNVDLALVIETLAASEGALIHETRELAAEVQAYRELAHVSVAEVARLVRVVERQSRTITALREELRRYTAATVLGRAA